MNKRETRNKLLGALAVMRSIHTDIRNTPEYINLEEARQLETEANGELYVALSEAHALVRELALQLGESVEHAGYLVTPVTAYERVTYNSQELDLALRLLRHTEPGIAAFLEENRKVTEVAATVKLKDKGGNIEE